MEQVFVYQLVGDRAQKLDQIKAVAAEKGVFFNGDLNGGQFSGRGLIGTYSISGSTITVVITTKPFIVSSAYIDSQLRAFIGG